MRKVFEQRRDLIVRRINACPVSAAWKPSGAFYVMMNLRAILGKQIDGQVIGSGDDFAKLLLERAWSRSCRAAASAHRILCA